MRCARAVRKVGCFRPVFPDGQGDRGHYRVPIHRTAQILTQSKISNELKPCFTLKMPDCCLNLLFLPCGHMLPWCWVAVRVVTGKLPYHRVLCARCAETPPNPTPGWGWCAAPCHRDPDRLGYPRTRTALNPMFHVHQNIQIQQLRMEDIWSTVMAEDEVRLPERLVIAMLNMDALD